MTSTNSRQVSDAELIPSTQFQGADLKKAQSLLMEIRIKMQSLEILLAKLVSDGR